MSKDTPYNPFNTLDALGRLDIPVQKKGFEDPYTKEWADALLPRGSHLNTMHLPLHSSTTDHRIYKEMTRNGMQPLGGPLKLREPSLKFVGKRFVTTPDKIELVTNEELDGSLFTYKDGTARGLVRQADMSAARKTALSAYNFKMDEARFQESRGNIENAERLREQARKQLLAFDPSLSLALAGDAGVKIAGDLLSMVEKMNKKVVEQPLSRAEMNDIAMMKKFFDDQRRSRALELQDIETLSTVSSVIDAFESASREVEVRGNIRPTTADNLSRASQAFRDNVAIIAQTNPSIARGGAAISRIGLQMASELVEGASPVGVIDSPKEPEEIGGVKLIGAPPLRDSEESKFDDPLFHEPVTAESSVERPISDSGVPSGINTYYLKSLLEPYLEKYDNLVESGKTKEADKIYELLVKGISKRRADAVFVGHRMTDDSKEEVSTTPSEKVTRKVMKKFLEPYLKEYKTYMDKDNIERARAIHRAISRAISEERTDAIIDEYMAKTPTESPAESPKTSIGSDDSLFNEPLTTKDESKQEEIIEEVKKTKTPIQVPNASDEIRVTIFGSAEKMSEYKRALKEASYDKALALLSSVRSSGDVMKHGKWYEYIVIMLMKRRASTSISDEEAQNISSEIRSTLSKMSKNTAESIVNKFQGVSKK